MPKFKVGNNTIALGNKEFLAQGGEGSVYAKGNTAYKIYLDPKRMIPLGKIQELSNISDPNVIKPDDIVYDGNNPVGYTMRYVKDTSALCQLFTRSFKDRNSIQIDQIIDLIVGMRNTINHIHSKDILIVDLNEMNFLVDSSFDEVYFIDADSYQTRNYRATALMESIRDRHTPNQFNIGTDWFAFAVVTFQLFIGIHPYKGRHAKLKGFDERMIANVSVFNKEVTIPKNCATLDVIPKGLYDWYFEVFENGLRDIPPEYFDVSRPLIGKVKISIVSASFNISDFKEYENTVLHYSRAYGVETVITNNRVYSGNAYLEMKKVPVVGVYGTDPYAVWREGEKVRIVHIITKKEISSSFSAESLMVYNGRIYIKYAESILELMIKNNVAMIKEVARVMLQATKLYPGIAIQNMLGIWIANTFPDSGLSYQYKLTDLNGYQIIDARFDSSILMVIATKDGQFDRFVYRLDGNKGELVRKIDDVNMASMNFVVLDSGTCVMLDEQGMIEAFNIKHPDKVKIIDDSSLCGNIKLFKNGGKVVFGQDNKLYNLSMK